MVFIKVASLLALAVVTTLAAPVYEEHKEEVEHHAPAHYQFKYGVVDGHTHDQKEQAEKRDGDKVEGYYKLVEPDGTTRTVHYTADKHTGFHAEVVKSGHATHPTYEKKVAIPVKKVVVPVKYEEPSYESSLGSGSSIQSSFGSSFGSSLGSSQLGSSHGSASSYSTFS
ncbi:cuticle protein 7-like [Periplaneta americana]|uniref:cuticle protein 7-like n=1 Tax=Periplaneta americana TaxID=6978 RepID=UPI0037E96174